MDLDMEKTRETHNLYIESIRESLKNIIKNMFFFINRLINLRKLNYIFCSM